MTGIAGAGAQADHCDRHRQRAARSGPRRLSTVRRAAGGNLAQLWPDSKWREAIIQGVQRDHLQYVVDHIREDDARELSATMWKGQDLVEHVMAYQGLSYTGFGRDGAPCGVGGLNIVSPGVGQAWLFGTPRIRDVRVNMTRHCRDVVDCALNGGRILHRVQALSAAFHADAHEWMRAIGFEQESTMNQYGRDGENFFVFVCLRESTH